MGNTRISLVPDSVNSSRVPSGLNRTSFAPALPGGRGTVAIEWRVPLVSRRKPVIFGVVPFLFSTYTKSPERATLLGKTPPEDDLLSQVNLPAMVPKTETSLLPALTATSRRPSPPNTKESCDPRGSAPLAAVNAGSNEVSVYGTIAGRLT